MESTQSIFEEKHISKAVFTLILPAMLGQLATLIYNIADTYFISLTKDPNQIAAVTLCSPALVIIMALGALFGIGGSSAIARHLGAGNEEEARHVSSYCMYTAVISSILVVVLGLVFLPQLTSLLGADSDNFAFTKNYLGVILCGTPFLMFTNTQLHVFRSVALIRQATIGLVVGNGSNIVLDYIFIVRMGMGTTGAALATALGFVIQTIYYLICMIRCSQKGNHLLPLSPKDYHFTWNLTKQVTTIGIPGGLAIILMCVSNIILNNYLSIYGSNAVAAYGIAYKLNSIPVMLLVGLSQGVSPLIGYCYGAKQFGRLRASMNLSSLYSIILGVFFTSLFFVTGEFFSSLFLEQPDLIVDSAHFLRILCCSGIAVGIINMATSFYQALGKAVPAMALTVGKNIVLFIPAIMILNSILKADGVIASQPVVEYTVAIICIVMYLVSMKKLKKNS